MPVTADIYHAPVAPQVPVADTTVAHLVGSIGNAGLAAFTQRAIAAQRASLDTEQMLQNAALQTDQHAIERDQMRQSFDLKTKEMELQRDLAEKQKDLQYDQLDQQKEIFNKNYEIQSGLKGAQMDMYEAHADAFEALAKSRATTGSIFAQRTAQNAATVADFQSQVHKYGLDDPNPSDPIQYYANAQKLRDEFGFSTVTDIKQGLKQVDLITQQHTIPLATPITEVDPNDPTGTPKTRYIKKQVPVGQIVQNLLDPQKQDATWASLEASGYVRATDTTQRDSRGKPTGPISTSTAFDPANPTASEIKSFLPAGLKADFARSKNRVPIGTVTAPDATPATPLFQPTEVDQLKSQAKAAIAAGKDPDAVKQVLQAKGIDTSDL